MSSLKSIEDLEIIFKKDEHAFWRVYSGANTKGNRIGENMSEEDVQASFDLLRDRIESYGDGNFCVCTMKNVGTANARCNVHVLKLGAAVVSGTGNSALGSFEQMITIMDYLNQRNDDAINGVVDEMGKEAKKDLEIFKLQMELKEAKNGSRFDRMMQALIPQLPGLLGVQAGQAGALGAIGFTDEAPDQKLPEKSGNADQVDLNQMLNLTVRLGKAFPDHNPVNVFEKVVQFAEKNPQAALQLLMQNQ